MEQNTPSRVYYELPAEYFEELKEATKRIQRFVEGIK